MFFVELKPVPNNDIQCRIYTTMQNKIRTTQTQRDIALCANSQRYGHTKNYCHLKLRRVKCTDNHMTNQCHQGERTSDVYCGLWGRNHPVNYKRYTVYEDLQKIIYPPVWLKQYTPLAQIKHILYTQPAVTYSQISKQIFLHSHKCRARATHTTSSASLQYTGLKKYDGKSFWSNGNNAEPPHNHAY
jgi:hypothetical protein